MTDTCFICLQDKPCPCEAGDWCGPEVKERDRFISTLITMRKALVLNGTRLTDDAINAYEELKLSVTNAPSSALSRQPSDMVLVPREPTEAMLKAGYPPNSEEAQDWGVAEVYRAMLAAAGKEKT